MKNILIFKDTLKKLAVKDIYTEGFLPEQIFYQLEPKLRDRLEILEKEITTKYKKYENMNSGLTYNSNSSKGEAHNATEDKKDSNTKTDRKDTSASDSYSYEDESMATGHSNSSGEDDEHLSSSESCLKNSVSASIDSSTSDKTGDSKGSAKCDIGSASSDEESREKKEIAESDEESDVEDPSATNSQEENSASSSLEDSDEETVSIDSELWGESHDSDVELVNRPASEVANILWKRKEKKK